MVHQYRPNFPHRFNEEGSFDPICIRCHLTVATAKIETELSKHERSHICSPSRRYPISECWFEYGAISIQLELHL